MEIYKMKINGCEVSVIFTGKNYFFHNSFFGWVCVAERTDESYERIGTDYDVQKFILYVGNGNAIGSCSMHDLAVIAGVKKFIKKNECKYVRKTCEFEEKKHDLNKCHVSVSYDLNRFG